jgi:hypothetical protein
MPTLNTSTYFRSSSAILVELAISRSHQKQIFTVCAAQGSLLITYVVGQFGHYDCKLLSVLPQMLLLLHKNIIHVLDKVCDYFGVKIALYFAYLGHYTTALLWPAALGALFWLLSGTHQVWYIFSYL